MRHAGRAIVWILSFALLQIGAPARISAAEIPADLGREAAAPRAERVEAARAALERAGLSSGEAERRIRSLDDRELAHLQQAVLEQRGADAFAATLVVVLVVVFLVGFFIVAAQEEKEQPKIQKRWDDQRRDEREKIQDVKPSEK